MKIALGCDHGGFTLKGEIIKHLKEKNIECIDFGSFDSSPVDYPIYAEKVANAVVKKECDFGILICGTGIGMSIAANKIKGIRASVVSDCFSAKYTRAHNDANILCLGARTTGVGLALELVDIFLSNDFIGSYHQKRLDLISQLENR